MTEVLSFTAPEFDAEPLCAETDPDAFFPDKGGSTRAAKAICKRCEVREACLAWALEHNERFGIWGGTSERDRRRMTREPKQRPINHGTAGGNKAHRRRGEKPCEDCRLAANLAKNERKARQAAA